MDRFDRQTVAGSVDRSGEGYPPRCEGGGQLGQVGVGQQVRDEIAEGVFVDFRFDDGAE